MSTSDTPEDDADEALAGHLSRDLGLSCLRLTRNAESVLRVLVDDRARTVGEIGRALDLRPTSVSRAVDELVTLGIARRGRARPTPVVLNPLEDAVEAIRVRASNGRNTRCDCASSRRSSPMDSSSHGGGPCRHR
ncbi:MAG: MarR family transcriptional regulator [Propionibacteriales bacterium]|nr:MarR family transcriptional regulator [Propionibacteriales bacterium]